MKQQEETRVEKVLKVEIPKRGFRVTVLMKDGTKRIVQVVPNEPISSRETQ